VLASQGLWGLGYTFTSGATQAWIADEVGEARAGQAFLRGAQIGTVGGLIGIPFSVGLASLHIRLPIVLSGVLFAGLSVYLALVMPEDGFKPTPAADRTTWQTMADTFRTGVQLVRARTVLLLFVGISVFFGLYSEGLDRLWTAHILENFALPGLGEFKPVVWFGVIGAVSMLFSIAATEVVRRRVDMNDPNAILRTLFAVTALMVASIFVFGLARQFGVALLALWAFQVFRSTGGPIFTAWINPYIESNVRATVFSMTGQVDAISQVAGGPVLGFIGTRASIRAAIVTSGVVLSPALALLARARRLTGPAHPDLPVTEPVAVE
jgi:DHA3 family tetracycline resistance protein-like MFS transporter